MYRLRHVIAIRTQTMRSARRLDGCRQQSYDASASRFTPAAASNSTRMPLLQLQ